VAFSSAYARWALIAEGGRPLGGLFAASLQEWVWIPLVLGLGMIAAIFPDGRFLSRGWRAALWIAAGLPIVPMITNALIPHLTSYRGYDNPLGVVGSTMQDLAPASIIAILPVILLGMASAIVRFRRSRGEERLQLKWLMLSAVALASLITLYGVTTLISPGEGSIVDHDWVEYLAVLAFLSIPVAIAFGVLRYRLYDIDVVVNKAVVYGAMAVFITVVYVAVVVGVGAAVGTTGDAALSAVAAAVVALAFQPVRRQMQRLANRIVYGERATPYEVLADLGERLAGEYSVEDVVVRVASTLATGVAAERVVVWLQVGRELRPAGAWPIDARAARIPLSDGEVPTELDGLQAFPVFHQGEPLGAIGVGKPAADPITPSDAKLIGDFAAQAGLVLRNVRLIEDLRASRQRLVAAQDEERRRIERNIHDGAQQQLVALAVKLRLADTVLGRDEERARALLAELQQDTTATLEDLRDLARGIYPPLLADQGLLPALEAQARRAAVPVEITQDGIGRYPREVEAAVNFCALESLQNIGKYAPANEVDIDLEARDGSLHFAVRDDGVGFDERASHGSGLTNMRDRLDALGGALEVRSKPGEGTTISGWIPLAAG
jgi:signal transduction histidine kinase